MAERPYLMDRGEHVQFGALTFGKSFDATGTGTMNRAGLAVATAIVPYNGYAAGIGVNFDVTLASAETAIVSVRKGATAVYSTTLASGIKNFSTQFTPTEVTMSAGAKLSVYVSHAALTTSLIVADLWIAHRANTL